MATIKVDSTAMRDKAATFKNIASNISTYTDRLEQEINGMKSVWEGEAAENTVAKFKDFKASFEEKKKVIEKTSKESAFCEHCGTAIKKM